MQNDIESVPVFLLLKKIFHEKLSGKLLVKSENTIKTLYIKQGYLTSVKSNVFDDRIGVILYLLEKIDSQQYDFISGLIHSPDKEVLSILLTHNVVSRDELNDAVNYQKRSVALSTFSIQKGIWQFTKNELLPMEDYNHPIPLTSLLYQGGREEVTTHFFKRRFYFHSPIPKGIPTALQHLFTDGEVKLLGKLANLKNLSCIDSMKRLDLQPIQFWQMVTVFWLFDILQFEKIKFAKRAKPEQAKPLIYKLKIDVKTSKTLETVEEAGLDEVLDEVRGFYQQKKFEPAIQLLKKLLQQAPNHGELYYHLALCQSNLEFFNNEAESNFKKAVELEPWNPEFSYALGIFFRENSRPQLAEKCFRRTLELNPNYVKAEKALEGITRSSKKAHKSQPKK